MDDDPIFHGFMACMKGGWGQEIRRIHYECVMAVCISLAFVLGCECH